MRSVRAVGAAVILSGCSESVTPPDAIRSRPDAATLAAAQLADAASGRQARGFEDEILRLEAKVPGIGGVFADSTGQFIIYVRDQAVSDSARSEFRRRAATLQLPAEIRQAIERPTGVTTRVGRYAFSQLVAWSKMLLWELGAQRGFVSIDADEAANRVRLTVSDEATKSAALSAAQVLNVPDEAIIVDLGTRARVTHTLRTTVRPISGSYQIMNPQGGACTLGWNVYLPGVGKGFITAGHCSGYFPGSGTTGAYSYQATNDYANLVGFETVNPPWNLTDPDCEGVPLCTNADVLFVKYNSDSWWTPRLAKTDLPVGINNAAGSIEADWYLNPIYSHMDPYVGLTVDKIGRTTGWTRGTVNATCVSGTETGQYFQTQFEERVLCADTFSGASGGFGDSGSPVFYKTTGDGIFFVGLLYARNGTAFGPAPDYRCTAGCVLKFTRYTRLRDHLGYGALVYN